VDGRRRIVVVLLVMVVAFLIAAPLGALLGPAKKNAAAPFSSNLVPVGGDHDPPVTTIYTSGVQLVFGGYGGNVTVTLQAVDNLSSVSLTEYRINGSSWITYTDPFVLNHTSTVEYFSVDDQSNSEPIRSEWVEIQRHWPTVHIAVEGSTGENGWYVSKATILVSTSTSQNGSPVIQTVYTVNKGLQWFVFTSDSSTPNGTYYSVPTHEGINSFGTYCVDAYQEASPYTGTTVCIDTVAPSVYCTANNNYSTGTITLPLSLADNTSGLAKIEISLDGAGFTSNPSSQVALTNLSDGSHTLIVRVSDMAGNSAQATVSFTVLLSTEESGLLPYVGAGVAIVAVVALVSFVLLARRKREGRKREDVTPNQNP